MSPTSLPFRSDIKLTEILARNAYTFSAEVIPPRNGTEQGKVLDQIEMLIGSGAEFLAVTKGAGGSLRGGSLPIAQAIKERFSMPCVAHFTCRDLNAEEVENSLMDHHYFGIRNILALRGDPPDGQTEWQPREGGHNFAHELITQIRAMNEGHYLERPGGSELSKQDPTDFCIGAAAYPEYPDARERIEFFRRKVEAGAHYGVTDMIFDAELYARFIDACERHGLTVPVLPGTRILKTRAQAERMAAKFRVSVPSRTLSRLPEEDGPEAAERGIELFMELAQRLRQLGAPGIHLFVISDTAIGCRALRQLAESRKQGKT
ncbi:MAG: methylenetetrahydrofolate reductase [Oligoflexia bacterium]|nr:methylenetetrahydrofolate reductase [Oligoflexia bacterium]